MGQSRGWFRSRSSITPSRACFTRSLEGEITIPSLPRLLHALWSFGDPLPLPRAQAARAVDGELRVPAVVRHVHAVHEDAEVVEGLEDRATLRHLVLHAVHADARHQSSKLSGKGHFPSSTWRSKSERKWRSRPCTGQAAASAKAQMV